MVVVVCVVVVVVVVALELLEKINIILNLPFAKRDKDCDQE